jgi:hypothetical protein
MWLYLRCLARLERALVLMYVAIAQTLTRRETPRVKKEVTLLRCRRKRSQ